MRLEKKFLRSQVARRMLLFFVLSAFIPILILAILSYRESNQLLIKQAQTRLDAASNIYRTSIYDRLLLLDQVLSEVSQQVTDNKLPNDLHVQLQDKFRHLALQFSDGKTIALLGHDMAVTPLDSAALLHLQQGQPLLLTQRSDSDIKMIILRAKSFSADRHVIIQAELVPEFLWGNPMNFALDNNLCVFNELNINLFCTNVPIHPDVQELQEKTSANKGSLYWQQHAEVFIASYHEIFLQAKFLTPRWVVLASQSEADALDSLKQFNTIFWGSVMVSILLILLLSMTQIRRILVPLEQLIDGTRRLSGRDFTAKVSVSSSDEFGELAASFNAMSDKLGHQFETLEALAKIDHEILSSLNIESIAADVLNHLKKLTGAEFGSISVMTVESSLTLHTVAIDDPADKPTIMSDVLLENTRGLLGHNQRGIWVDHRHIKQQIKEYCTTASANFFLLPLSWKEQMVGFIALGCRNKRQWAEDESQLIQDYADRVAVALFTRNREELLVRQARIDSLTGLPNRFLFVEQLQKEIAKAHRTTAKFAVFYIDLDRFKNINDSLGHAMGDRLLCDAGRRLQQCVRESDMVARLGGDEFAILVNPLDHEHTATRIADDVIQSLTKPFFLDGDENVVGASIGIALFPGDGESIEELMRNSDIAMYRAKANSGNRYIFFEESMNTEVVRRANIERELRKAIAEKQFVLHYQPQIDPKTNLPRGVETLVRWNHPRLGLISPGSFIGIAEDAGLIVDIGYLILHEACAQFRAWVDQGIVLDYVAVNVSVEQFSHVQFVQSVEAALRSNDMPAHCLELEITESVLMNDTNAVLEVLHRLRQMGVQLSIDDFGTGYSSLSYLEQLPFDTLKIDISFVKKIQNDCSGGTIAATIAAMAHTLGKKVVAEGVETQAQLDFLRNHDCELIQGFYFSRPLPASELAAFVNSEHGCRKD